MLFVTREPEDRRERISLSATTVKTRLRFVTHFEPWQKTAFVEISFGTHETSM